MNFNITGNKICYCLLVKHAMCPYSCRHGFWKIKKCEISLAIASCAAELFDRMKNTPCMKH